LGTVYKRDSDIDKGKKASLFVPGKLFQPVLLLECKKELTLKRGVHERRAPEPVNVRARWRGFPGKNALALLASSSATNKNVK
jgi:hypothetical protein